MSEIMIIPKGASAKVSKRDILEALVALARKRFVKELQEKQAKLAKAKADLHVEVGEKVFGGKPPAGMEVEPSWWGTEARVHFSVTSPVIQKLCKECSENSTARDRFDEADCRARIRAGMAVNAKAVADLLNDKKFVRNAQELLETLGD